MTKDGLIFTSWIILILAVLYFPFGNSQALGTYLHLCVDINADKIG